MTTDTTAYEEPDPLLRRRMIPAGGARVAVFRRTYQTTVEERLSPGPEAGTAVLELQHATTLDSHNIGGHVYDAVFCIGGGYYPRLLALDLHLRGSLPEDYDSAAFHKDPNMRSTIERGSAAMAVLLAGDAER